MIDYSAATITADDGTGKGVALKPVDSNGKALTSTLSVSVQLDNRNHLVISPGLTSRLLSVLPASRRWRRFPPTR